MARTNGGWSGAERGCSSSRCIEGLAHSLTLSTPKQSLRDLLSFKDLLQPAGLSAHTEPHRCWF
jgi:hypothetical protein